MATERQQLRPWAADVVERWEVGRILPYERNPMGHSQEQVDLLAESMRRFGVTTPVLVDEAGVLIYGHGRVLAAKKLGLMQLPVCIARGWTVEEKSAYRIADNQLNRLSDWDMPKLSIELRELHMAGGDLPMLGFNEAQLGALLMDEVKDPLAEWRDMPEFKQDDKRPFRSIFIHFRKQEDVDAFIKLITPKLIGQEIGAKTKWVWYPEPEPIEPLHDKKF